VTGEWTEAAGERIYARRLEGPVGAADVVLVHGLVVSGRYMLPLARELSGHHRVLVPDLPGTGRSRATRTPPGIDPLGDALAAWLDARGLDRPHVVANSAGCQIAAAALQRHPGRVRSLALVGPTMDPSARIHQHALRWLRTSRHEPPSLNLVVARDWLDMRPRRALAMARNVLADRLEPRLPGLGVPVLVVRGTQDAIADPRWAERVATAAGGRVVTIPGAHALNFSRPDALAAVLRAFFGMSDR
jgi:pimeloyl-ACP methyl ester carboxylesterase